MLPWSKRLSLCHLIAVSHSAALSFDCGVISSCLYIHRHGFFTVLASSGCRRVKSRGESRDGRATDGIDKYLVGYSRTKQNAVIGVVAQESMCMVVKVSTTMMQE